MRPRIIAPVIGIVKRKIYWSNAVDRPKLEKGMEFARAAFNAAARQKSRMENCVDYLKAAIEAWSILA